MLPSNEIEIPEGLEDGHLEFLDDLRDSGVSIMYGACPYLMDAFGELTEKQAAAILVYWMRTFGQRHPWEAT